MDNRTSKACFRLEDVWTARQSLKPRKTCGSHGVVAYMLRDMDAAGWQWHACFSARDMNATDEFGGVMLVIAGDSWRFAHLRPRRACSQVPICGRGRCAWCWNGTTHSAPPLIQTRVRHTRASNSSQSSDSVWSVGAGRVCRHACCRSMLHVRAAFYATQRFRDQW